jgi:hypothetical protein
MSTITARITRPIIAAVIAGAVVGAVATPYMVAKTPSITTIAHHSASGPDNNSPWPK